MVNTKKRRR